MKRIATILLSSVFTLCLLALDVIYVRWAWFSDAPQADVPSRIVIGVLLGLFTAHFVWFTLHRIAAALKGSLRLVFPDRPYTWGDQITGEVVLRTRQRLQLQRFALTLCAERRVSRDKSHDWVKVVEQIQDIPLEENLLTGTRSIPFAIQIPAAPPPQASFQWPEALKGVGTLLEGVQRTFDPLGLSPQLQWTLEIRAQLPGADLVDSHTLRFNHPPRETTSILQ